MSMSLSLSLLLCALSISRQIPFVTVVTDLGGAHPTWFHKDVDLCFVPSDPVRKIALDMGLAPDQVTAHISWREGGSGGRLSS
jgi:hypothetical protein